MKVSQTVKHIPYSAQDTQVWPGLSFGWSYESNKMWTCHWIYTDLLHEHQFFVTDAFTSDAHSEFSLSLAPFWSRFTFHVTNRQIWQWILMSDIIYVHAASVFRENLLFTLILMINPDSNKCSQICLTKTRLSILAAFLGSFSNFSFLPYLCFQTLNLKI